MNDMKVPFWEKALMVGALLAVAGFSVRACADLQAHKTRAAKCRQSGGFWSEGFCMRVPGMTVEERWSDGR